MAGTGVGKAATGLLTQHPSFIRVYLLCCVPTWRFHFHREIAWPNGRTEGCELGSDVLTQPLKQPSALSTAPPASYMENLIPELWLPSWQGQVGMPSPACGPLLPSAFQLFCHLPAVMDSHSSVVISCHLSDLGRKWR